MMKEIDTGGRPPDFEEGDDVRDVFRERNATVVQSMRRSVLIEYRDGLRATVHARHLTHRSDG